MTLQERLKKVFKLTLPKLGPSSREQLAALISPESLAIIAGVIGAWIAGHAFGVGELVDIALTIGGFLSIGVGVFSGIDELYSFARLTWTASSDTDFDRAAAHLARAISILGIQVVLAMLFKRRPTGGRLPAGQPPPVGAGLRYKPLTVRDPALPAGEGATSFWGDIEVSTAGSAQDQAIVLLHEQVHQFLAPKFYLLRRIRVENRVGSYFKSSLYRYIEEALAESVGQIGVNGFSRAFVGLRFPVQNGYVYLARTGGFDAYMRGAGLASEGAGLVGAGSVSGFAFEVWFRDDAARSSGTPGSNMPR